MIGAIEREDIVQNTTEKPQDGHFKGDIIKRGVVVGASVEGEIMSTAEGVAVQRSTRYSQSSDIS